MVIIMKPGTKKEDIEALADTFRAQGLDDRVWFHAVETVNAGRGRAAFAENRQYPRRILKERQHAYIRAGWGPGIEEGGRP